MADPGEIKLVIKAVLVSSPLAMSVADLCREYRNIEGREIPFRDLGFNNIETYLRSLQDTLVMKGSGIRAEVTPIVTQNTAHLVEMIAKQKKPKSRVYRRPAAHLWAQPTKAINHHKPIPPPEPQMQFIPTHQTLLRPQINNFNVPGYFQQPVPLMSIHYNTNVPLHFVPPPPGFHQLRNTMNNFNTSTPAPEINSVHSDNSSTYSTDCDITSSQRNGSADDRIISPEVEEVTTSDTCNYAVPFAVQLNCRKLISEHPNGIWCKEFSRLYRSTFGEPFSFTDFGYDSLMQMCSALPNIFDFIQQEAGDYKLFDKTKPIPQEQIRLLSQKQTPLAAQAHKSSLPLNVKALLKVDINMPPDVMKIGDRIPHQNYDFVINDFVEIRMGEIYDPSKFWFNLKTFNDQLDDLMDRMQEFYKEHAKEYEIKRSLQKRLYCAAIILGEYHRAVICDMLPEEDELVKAHFIDYGTVSVIPKKGICYLSKRFSVLRSQGFRGRLAGVRPVREEATWSRTTSNRLLQLVLEKALTAQIIKIDKENHVYDMIIAEKTDVGNLFLHEVLVKEGLAVMAQQQQLKRLDAEWRPRVKKIYLYPTHEELESGDAPTATEITQILKVHVSMRFIHPQYYHKVDDEADLSEEENMEEESSIISTTASETRLYTPTKRSERKHIVTAEIYDKVFHIMLYNDKPHVSVQEVQMRTRGFIKDFVRCRTNYLTKLDLLSNPTLKSALLNFDLIDASAKELEILPLQSLHRFASSLIGTKYSPVPEDVLKLYNSESHIWLH